MTIGFGEPFGSGQPIAEMSDSATAPAFASFDELKAAIETEPTIVSTALLIQAVQSRLQRLTAHAGMTDAEIEEHCKAEFEICKDIPGFDLPRLTERARVQRDEHVYLKRALAVLEARLADAASTVNREDWRARLRRLGPDDPVPSPIEPPAVADPASELPDAVKALFSDAAAFERELAPHVGGDSAEPMRGMLGAALSMLVQHYDVEPRQLADYVREVLRFTYPEAFQ
jgi:hypothetical protein